MKILKCGCNAMAQHNNAHDGFEADRIARKHIETLKKQKLAHTKELEELDRKWRKKVAGLRMGGKCDTCRGGGRYVYIKTCPFCPDGIEFNSKINQLLEEHGK